MAMHGQQVDTISMDGGTECPGPCCSCKPTEAAEAPALKRSRTSLDDGGLLVQT